MKQPQTSGEVVHNLQIDERQDAYRIERTPAWARRFTAAAEEKGYGDAAIDLAFDLQVAAMMASFAYVLTKQLSTFANSHQHSPEAETPAERVVHVLAARVCTELRRGPNGHLFDAERLGAIQAACFGLSMDVAKVPGMAASKIDAKTWEDYLANPGFKCGAWASQRIGYLSIYNAYEHFLTQCIRVKLGDPLFDLTPNVAKDSIRLAFGQTTLDECWNHHRLLVARQVRHAVSHNGGKETSKLQKLRPRHGIVVLPPSGMLQIMPHDVKLLLTAVENTVLKFIQLV